MKARHLIGSSIFGPQALQVVFRAFDGAWSEIEVRFGSDQRAIERARTRLAYAILLVASEDSDDPESLKREALKVMAATSPDRE